MKQPFFSVVIPLFNKEKFISKTIKSVLEQTFLDFELIVVNDGSTDSSLKIVNSFSDLRIRVISQENKGLSATRNVGIFYANAPYIAFLDADDTWDKMQLNTFFQLIKDFPEADIFATNYVEQKKENSFSFPKHFFSSKLDPLLIENYFEIDVMQPIYCLSSLCVSKKVVQKHLFDTSITFAEDIDFKINISIEFKTAYHPNCFAKYCMYDQNQITKSSMLNKKIPTLSKYEVFSSENPGLKKYLDFHRYVWAKQFKMSRDIEKYYALKSQIDPDNNISGLNYKQKLLLESPYWFLKFVAFFKKILEKNGLKIQSY